VLAVGLVLAVGSPALFALDIRFGPGHRVAAAAPGRAAVVGGIIVIIWGRILFAG
jgi:hypothetical protein